MFHSLHLIPFLLRPVPKRHPLTHILETDADSHGLLANSDLWQHPSFHVSMRDSATSAMRGCEHWKPDGLASELFLDQLILLES
jgi:hypothetical protein